MSLRSKQNNLIGPTTLGTWTNEFFNPLYLCNEEIILLQDLNLCKLASISVLLKELNMSLSNINNSAPAEDQIHNSMKSNLLTYI